MNVEELINNIKEELQTPDFDSKLDEIKSEYKSIEDKNLRLYAEFENFKRRTEKEKSDIIKTGSEKVIVDFLPIIDDLERSLEFIKDESTKSGNEMILNKLIKTLESKGVKKIETIGNKFDDNLHEAITMVDGGSEQSGKVIDEVESGYILNDKVIRHSKVVVGK